MSTGFYENVILADMGIEVQEKLPPGFFMPLEYYGVISYDIKDLTEQP